MDHIKLPVDRDHLDIIVPYLVTPEIEHDGIGLDESPTRKWLTRISSNPLTDPLTLASLRRRPARDAVGFVQSRLYFGLLREVLGPEYREQDWIKAGRICSSSLPAVISKRHQTILDMDVRQGGDDGLSATYEKSPSIREREEISRVIRKAIDSCDQLDEPWDALGWRGTLLAVRILIQRLGTLARTTPSIVGARKGDAASVALIWEHMVQRKSWCAHQVRHMLTRVSYEGLYYLANLRRRERLDIDHKQCQLHDRCIVNNIKDDNYSDIHTTPGCDCVHVEAPVPRMHSILRDGGIPVVKYQENSSGDPHLDYVEAAPGARYTAISHLWADGIGNPWGQSIPRCQLKQLTSRIAQSNALVRKRKVAMHPQSTPLYFWFDVYCVPATASNTHELLNSELDEQPEMQNLKAIALARMTASYSWAQYVLVLDSELASSSGQRSLKELIARVAVCNWNTRCWTYQEFALGNRVVAYFQDGPKVLFDGRLFNASSSKWSDLGQNSLRDGDTMEGVRDVVQLIHPTQEHRNALLLTSDRRTVRWKIRKPDRPSTFISLCNTLNQKSSTKPADVFHILANLLGLSPAELSTLTEGERIKALLRTIPSLPLDLLLVNTPRLHKHTLDDQSAQQKEDCWIPSSVYHSRMDENMGMMHVTDMGMKSHLPSLWSGPTPGAAAFSVSRVPGQRWRARLDCDVKTMGPKGTRIEIVLDRAHHGSVSHELNSTFLLILRMSRSGGVRTGVCFTPLREVEHIQHVSFYCNFTWTILEGVQAAELDESTDEDLTLALRSHRGDILLECG